MVAVPGIALLVNYWLNNEYRKLWDEIDPPKPGDEEALTLDEVVLINQCDQNFDNWNTKYFGLGTWVYRLTVGLSHKFFQFPFTHFFGYLHCTMRTQDHYAVWQWDELEVKKFQIGRINQKDLKREKPRQFKYKGKLVPKKAENMEAEMLKDDMDYNVNAEGGDDYQGGEYVAEQHNEDQYEGGVVERAVPALGQEQSAIELQEYQYEGGKGRLDQEGDLNPFHYVQHPRLYPRRDHEKVPDTRVWEVYKKQVKVDLLGIRIILIIGNIVLIAVKFAAASPNQLFIAAMENILLSCVMVGLQIYFYQHWEEHRLPFKMKDTKANYLFKAKKAPNLANKNQGKTDDDELMPEWSKYMHLYKFNEIFLDNKLEELLNIFGRRQCKSCIEFNTGQELEEDPRKVKSWPLSPKGEVEYQGMAGDFDLIDF